jgi:hypothetical protein
MHERKAVQTEYRVIDFASYAIDDCIVGSNWSLWLEAGIARKSVSRES